MKCTIILGYDSLINSFKNDNEIEFSTLIFTENFWVLVEVGNGCWKKPNSAWGSQSLVGPTGPIDPRTTAEFFQDSQRSLSVNRHVIRQLAGLGWVVVGNLSWLLSPINSSWAAVTDHQVGTPKRPISLHSKIHLTWFKRHVRHHSKKALRIDIRSWCQIDRNSRNVRINQKLNRLVRSYGYTYNLRRTKKLLYTHQQRTRLLGTYKSKPPTPTYTSNSWSIYIHIYKYLSWASQNIVSEIFNLSFLKK